MEILERKESKLLGRTELQVLFPEKAGTLKRKEAVKEVAEALKARESEVALLELIQQSGSRNLVGRFHVYAAEGDLKLIGEKYLSVRLLTKEERDALKQAAKKAAQAQKAK